MRQLALASFSVLCLASTAPAFADDFEVETPDPAAFKEVSKDLVSAFNYKALQPAEATGITGFGIGVFGSYASTNEDAWRTLTGEDVGEIGTVGVAAHKGLPFGIDLGAFYSVVPTQDAKVFGAEARWAIWKGGIATPGLAIRGAYTTTSGIEDLDVTTYSLDASISKGFTFITPYAGVGYVWGDVDASGYNDRPTTVIELDKQNVDATRVFVGARISLGFFGFTPEYERVGSRDVFNLRFGLSF